MRVHDLFEQSSSSVVLPDGTATTAVRIAQEGRVLARKLQREGLQVGDRVAVRLPNGHAYLTLIVACAVGRFVLVSVNTRYSDAEVNDLIARSGARRVFDGSSIDGSSIDGINADGSVIDGSNADGSTVDTHRSVDMPAEDSAVDDSMADDPFLVFTTSGTTNKPKLVRHTQRSIATHGSEAARGFGYRGDDTALLVMPFCGTFGVSSLTAAIAANASIVVVDQFDAATVSRLIQQHGVTVVNGSDDMFHRLVEHGANLSTIRLGGYARFNSSLDGIVGRADRAGATLSGLYGMSEVQALFSLRDPSLDVDQREQAGGTLVSPSGQLRIADGELYVRGPSLFEGYLTEGGAEIDTDLTEAHFVDGWFRTGDAATSDGDRTFTYHSRITDVLRLGGFLVSPSEIESALLDVQGIEQAQVVAVDMATGARPVAFVIAPAGFDEEDALAHCQRRLAKYKVPIRMILVDSFPTTQSANGTKIQRTKLREMAEKLFATQ
jgi:fatty-acyl-CoA synthase